MSLTGIRDVDIEIILKLDDSELPRVCMVNKYINKICQSDDFWYKKIINKIVAAKKDNFLKVKELTDIEVTGKRIKQMKEFFGFQSLRELNDFLNLVNSKAPYQIYYEFDRPNFQNGIKKIYGDLNEIKLPKYINRDELVYEIKRNYVITEYPRIYNINSFVYDSFFFNLSPKASSYTTSDFEIFKKLFS